MKEPVSFVSLLWVLLLAFLVPLLTSRIRWLHVPEVVWEIIAGMLFGVSGFHLIHQDIALDIMAGFGFSFLMFLAGLEIDFGMITSPTGGSGKLKENPAFFSLVIFLGTLSLASAAALWMKRIGLVGRWTTVALILSTTSLGVVVPVLKEKGIIVGRYGQTLLLSALIADFATMLLITVEATILSSGLTMEIFLVSILFVLFFLAYRSASFFSKWGLLRRTVEELAGSTSQIRVRGAFALMLLFVALSEKLGTEIILGAFLAGAVMALLYGRSAESLLHKLEAMGYGFFIPIFFIRVGANFDLQAFLSDPRSIYIFMALLVAAYMVKLFPAMALRRAFSLKESVAGGFLLSSRLTLIIAAAAIGVRLGVVDSATNAAIILVAVVTCTVSPLLFGTLFPTEYGGGGARPVIVIGEERVGILLTQRLMSRGEPVTMVVGDPDVAGKLEKKGVRVVLANPLDEDALVGLGVESARAVVVATSDDRLSLKVCRLLRSGLGVDRVIAWVREVAMEKAFRELGVLTVSPVINGASVMEMVIHAPDVYHLLAGTLEEKDTIEVRLTNPHFVGKMLRQISIPGDVLVMSIRRGGEVFVPHGDTKLERGDCLSLIGDKDMIAEVVKLLGDVECGDFSTDYRLSDKFYAGSMPFFGE